MCQKALADYDILLNNLGYGKNTRKNWARRSYFFTFLIESMQSPPMAEKIMETMNILEKPKREITVAAIMGAIAYVTVLPRL